MRENRIPTTLQWLHESWGTNKESTSFHQNKISCPMAEVKIVNDSDNTAIRRHAESGRIYRWVGLSRRRREISCLGEETTGCAGFPVALCQTWALKLLVAMSPAPGAAEHGWKVELARIGVELPSMISSGAGDDPDSRVAIAANMTARFCCGDFWEVLSLMFGEEVRDTASFFGALSVLAFTLKPVGVVARRSFLPAACLRQVLPLIETAGVLFFLWVAPCRGTLFAPKNEPLAEVGVARTGGPCHDCCDPDAMELPLGAWWIPNCWCWPIRFIVYIGACTNCWFGLIGATCPLWTDIGTIPCTLWQDPTWVWSWTIICELSAMEVTTGRDDCAVTPAPRSCMISRCCWRVRSWRNVMYSEACCKMAAFETRSFTTGNNPRSWSNPELIFFIRLRSLKLAISRRAFLSSGVLLREKRR